MVNHQHYRHTVMDSSDQRIRLADNYCRRTKSSPNALAVEFPEAGEGEGLAVLAGETPRLLAVGERLPFEEAGRRDERPPLLERLGEHRQLLDRLRSRVDVRYLRLLLHPERDETPAGEHYLARTVAQVDPGDRDLVGRRDVVGGGKFQSALRMAL